MRYHKRLKGFIVTLCAGVWLLAGGCGAAADTDSNARTEAAEESGDSKKQTEAADIAETQQNGAADNGTAENGSADEVQQEEEEGGSAVTTGLTISIMGDSISTFDDWIPEGYYDFFPEYGEVEKVEETWWKKVIDELEMELYVNASSAGATCVGYPDDIESPQYGCNDLRTNDLCGPGGSIPDIILVYMGTNDCLKGISLGENDGTKLIPEGKVRNFSDAYTLIIDKLETNYPISRIYCCTLLPIGDYGTETPFVEFVNGLELTSSDYNECIRQIADNRGCTVIDLEYCGIAVDNLTETTSDGVHPTVEGMTCISDAVESVLEKGLN